MAGPEAGGGFDFQAEVYSYVMCHGIGERDLAWFEGTECIPAAVRLESGGAGDDIRVETRSGKRIEIQSKKGLSKDSRFWESIDSLLIGLIEDNSLLGVLLVDSNSSGTIRGDLQKDLLRVSDGCEDGLKPITGELLAHAQGMDGYSIAVFRRLRIIQLDLKPGSAGRQAASNLLRHILLSNSDIESCWSFLTEQGHDLITRSGRQTVDDVAERVACKFNTIPSNRGAVIRGTFCHWVVESNRRFFIPGLGLYLDIDKAWMRLRVPEKGPSQERERESLAQQIARYHEWERLALSESSSDCMEMEHVFRFCPRTVVIGGPGSGKSTLTKRIAWRLATEGSLVWRVRLPVVLRLVRNGCTFQRALLEAATDGSGIATESLEHLDPPDLLLADGLDECGVANNEVAAELLKWSTGHAKCGVWVTTRPVGYQAGLLPEFRHCELLPLSKDAVQEHSRRLFDASGIDLTRAFTLWVEFCCSIEARVPSHRVATLAARNPLLLGFIVKLMIDGVELGASRGELYKQVVAILGATPSADREAAPNVPPQLARYVLRIAGWLSVKTLTQERDEFVDLIVAYSAMKPARLLLNHCAVSDCLAFWEQQGLLERLSVGHRTATTFIHPSLAEFAAAELVCSFDEAELRSWIRETRRDARWRQVILLAAGLGEVHRVTNALLELDDPNEPCSTEACLAAAAIAETTCEAATDSATQVITALATRIESPIPLVSIEAASSLLSLSSYMPNVIADTVGGLCDHEQPWTSLGARTLLLLTRSESLGADRIAAWLLSTPAKDKFTAGSQHHQSIRDMLLPNADEAELRNRQVVLLAERLLDDDKPRAFEAIAKFSRLPYISYGMLESIKSLYKKHGAEDRLIELYDPLATEPARWIAFANWRSEHRRMHEVVAGACLDAMGQARVTGPLVKNELLNLAAVYQCIGLGETPAGESRFIQDPATYDVLVEVVRLAIATASLGPSDVAREANLALDQLGSDDAPVYNIWLTKVPVDRDWARAVAVTPDVPKLERAFVHRNSAIAWFAANVLAQEAFRDQAPGVFRRVLETGTRATLCFVSQDAHKVFGDGAAVVLLDRLRRHIHDGSEFLYQALAKIADESNRGPIAEAIIDGINNQSAEIAKGAAEALCSLTPPPGGDFLSRIQGALSKWTERRSHCDEHDRDVKGQRQCPNCIVVPPSPRASLIATLDKMGALSLADILRVLSDEANERRDVVETATKLIRKRAEANPEIIAELLPRIGAGELPVKLLDELLTVPLEIKTGHARKLKDLLSSPHAPVRMAIVHALPEGWLENETATSAARLSLRDDDPSVRNAAIQALRRLQNEC